MSGEGRRRRVELLAAVLASGAAGLSWELLWQQRTALALGVSAQGAAVTLAAMMGGMGLGSLLAARAARRGLARPLSAYGSAELLVGLGGLLVPFGLSGLARLDAALYPVWPTAEPALQVVGMVVLLLVPATAMGATLPLLAACAPRFGTSVSAIYALQVFGAVLGVLVATFAAIPALGLGDTERLAAAANCAVALWAVSRGRSEVESRTRATRGAPAPRAALLAFGSGFAIFALEVSWFRSLRAALQSTTESFALILSSFLLALALGAFLAPRIRRRFPDALPLLIPLAALAVVCATPAIDSLDLFLMRLQQDASPAHFSARLAALRFAALFVLMVAPAALLGTILPWQYADHDSTEGVGWLTAVNTVGSALGAIVAGFVLLPWLGASHASAVAALAVLGAGAASLPPRRFAAAGAAALCAGVAVHAAFGGATARMRVQGYGSETAFDGVLYLAEGADHTVWVTRNRAQDAVTLVIDGFAASAEGAGSEYMRWMGHLPGLARPSPKNALVICFGTGQTTHAVRMHGPEKLWVADVSAEVFAAAPLFASNEGVLEDARVEPVVMDGRAFLRRSGERRYDLVTLEPMPPNFAGVNNLYSLEFYELLRRQLAPGGVAAQWVPFHLIDPRHMRSIVATFHAVFPYTRLWIEPLHGTGILVGSDRPWQLHPSPVELPPHPSPVEAHFRLGFRGVAALSSGADLVTDDNQLLSYGWDRFRRTRSRGRSWYGETHRQNLDLIRAVRARYASS